MAEEIKSLSDLKSAVAEETPEGEAAVIVNEAPVYEIKRDEHGRAYATGKRKDAIARVWVKPGKGVITVNGREFEKYFARPVLRMVIGQPFDVANVSGQFDVVCTVSGGGLSGQLRPSLKQAGFLTRDPRVVERKKYGKAKARRSFQFSKR